MAPFRRRGGLLFPFALISTVWADYYIDDTNTTLTYSSGPKAAWAPYAVGAETLELLLPNGTYQVIDAFVCWNHTYRYAACFDTDTCLLTVPFTGSGITVYVYQAGPVGINASITIDNAHAQTNVLNAPPAPNYENTNVSMFNVQQLQSGPHTLSLLINDLSGSYSGMMFDYAYVNESLVTTTTTTTTATSTSTPTPTGSSSVSHSDIGAIVGGVIAVVSLIVVGVLAFLWIRRRRGHRPEMMINLHSDYASPPLTPRAGYDTPNTAGMYDPYTGSTNNTARNHLAPSRTTEVSSFTPLVPNRLASSDVRRTPSSPGSGGQDILTPFIATSSTSNSSNKTRLGVSNDTDTANVAPQTGHSPTDSRQDTSPLLTDEQADFVNSLHLNNVPAAAIARVMERMLADRHAGIREWERETRLARTNTMTTAPPSYDLVAERG
ncbi:hypothetical protein OG21DRAFT_1504252 [Imleria badia]|nr:hypothetical protein OG21DRAFT_1504252 [Imleria badia]